MTIGQVARIAAVGVETVRFYQRKGLIEQPGKPLSGGYREYPAGIVRRIRFIKKAQKLGFSLKEIRVLLNLRADPHADCDSVRREARQKLTEVEARMVQLRNMREALRSVIRSCPTHGALSECPIIAALEDAGTQVRREGM